MNKEKDLLNFIKLIEESKAQKSHWFKRKKKIVPAAKNSKTFKLQQLLIKRRNLQATTQSKLRPAKSDTISDYL